MSAEAPRSRGAVLMLCAIAASAALVLAYLAAGGSELRARQDPGPMQAPGLGQPGRPPADPRAVLALGPRRGGLQARRLARDPGPGPRHAELARTLRAALRGQRRRTGAGDTRRPAARSRRRRRSGCPVRAARLRGALGDPLDPARPGDRTRPQRQIHLQRRGLDRRPRRRRPGTGGRIPALEGDSI